MEATRPSGGRWPGLALMGQIVAVAALLLPAIGVGLNWLRFSISRLPDAWLLATLQSVPSLAIRGLFPLTFVFVTVGMVVLEYRLTLQAGGDAAPTPLLGKIERVLKSPRKGRHSGRLYLLFMVAYFIWVIFLTPGSPGGLVMIVAGLALATAGLRAARSAAKEGRRLTVSVLWPAILLGGIVAVATGAFSVYPDGAMSVQFAEGGPEDGSYFAIGADDGLVYLVDCQAKVDRLPVIALPASSIDQMSLAGSRVVRELWGQQTLWHTLTGGGPLYLTLHDACEAVLTTS